MPSLWSSSPHREGYILSIHRVIHHHTTHMGRQRTYIIALTDEQVKVIRDRLHASMCKTRKLRLRILLLLDTAHCGEEGRLGYDTIAGRLGVCRNMVANVVRCFAAGGIEKVLEIKRNAKSDTSCLKVDASVEELILGLARSEAPEGRDRWTLRLLAEKSESALGMAIGKDTIRRILKKSNFDLMEPILWTQPVVQPR